MTASDFMRLSNWLSYLTPASVKLGTRMKVMAAFTSPLRDPVSIRVLAVCARHNDSAGFLAGKRRHQPSLTP